MLYKKIKIRYVLVLLLVVVILLTLSLNTSKLDLKLIGYGFYQDSGDKANNFKTERVEVIIDAYINDTDLSNDRIEISYDGIRIIENIILDKEGEFWIGYIIHFDNINAMDEIIGDIVLFNKSEECFISLYNENLNIVAPADDVETAIQKYSDFYIKSSEYN